MDNQGCDVDVVHLISGERQLDDVRLEPAIRVDGRLPAHVYRSGIKHNHKW